MREGWKGCGVLSPDEDKGLAMIFLESKATRACLRSMLTARKSLLALGNTQLLETNHPCMEILQG